MSERVAEKGNGDSADWSGGEGTGIAPPGEFPFPVLPDGRESRQLVWLRNHASYMASGALDYARLVSVMIRGILTNLLFVMPLLLLMGVAVAVLSVRDWDFPALLITAAIAVLWMLLAPFLTRIWNAARSSRVDRLGTTSSVVVRNKHEKAFARLLIAVLVVALIEGMSAFLDTFHHWTREGAGWKWIVTAGPFVLGALATVGRQLPKFGQGARTVALLGIGAAGLLVPFSVVMLIADILVFDLNEIPEGLLLLVLATGGLIALLLLVAALVIGIADFRSSSSRSTAALAVAVALALTSLVGWGEEISWLDNGRSNVATVTIGNDPGVLDSLVGKLLGDVDRLREEVERARSTPEDLARLAVGLRTGPGRQGSSDEEVVANLHQRVALLRPLLEVDPDSPPQLIEAALDIKIGSADLRLREDGQWLMEEGTRLVEEGEWLIEEGEWLIEEDEWLIEEDEWLIEEGTRLIEEGEWLIEESGWWTATGRWLIAAGNELDRSEVVYEDLFYALFDEVVWQDDPAKAASEFKELFICAGAVCPAFSLDRHPPSVDDSDLKNISNSVTSVEAALLAARRQLAEAAIDSSRHSRIADAATVADIRWQTLKPAALFALILAAVIALYAWVAIDPNRTSLNAMYRDRLASAFLVGPRGGWLEIEPDLDLEELCRYDAKSTAPYHLINAAVNLQGSKNIQTQDRKSDFFIFSKRFVGSKLTGYCRTETMERVFPELSLATAMAVSGAAASPNMGRSTKPALVAMMTFLNVRLGLWAPNPGFLEDGIANRWAIARRKPDSGPPGLTPADVLGDEQVEIEQRWANLPHSEQRTESGELLGLAFSGGGIRSATLNLGIVQSLHAAGVFAHVDYMSTVSGGGYLGAAISSAMRSQVPTRSEERGPISVSREDDAPVLTLPSGKSLRYTKHARIDDKVASGAKIKVGQRLLDLDSPASAERARAFSVGEQFRWRARPTAFLREAFGRVNERSRSVHLSDGGHIENLATIELLRRRCKYVIVGDAEMDPEHHFAGLIILLRTARIEEGIEIEIDLDPLRLEPTAEPENDSPSRSPLRYAQRQWAIGKITYPATADHETSTGYLLYLKASLTGAEPETIRGYRAKSPKFPHESTADQFFDEGQFEAYRTLGRVIGTRALTVGGPTADSASSQDNVPFAAVQKWFEELWRQRRAKGDETGL